MEAQDLADLKYFVQCVARAFYDIPQIILVDLLLRQDVWQDDDLSKWAGLTRKEVAKVLLPLLVHKLVKSKTRPEMRNNPPQPFERPIQRTYYWIDKREFCDVVRWRIDQCRRALETKLKADTDNKGYICPNCHTKYHPLYVPNNFSPSGMFLCENCGFELVDDDNSESIKGSKDKMAMFNDELKHVRSGLKKSQEMTFQNFEIDEWLRINARSGEVPVESGIRIEMALAGDEEKKEAERKRIAEEQRSQNQMPVWHMLSTVSGQKTALGYSIDAQNEAAALRAGIPSSTLSTNEDEESGKTSTQHANSLEAYYTNLKKGSSSGNSPSSNPAVSFKVEPESDDSDFENDAPQPPRTALINNNKRPHEEISPSKEHHHHHHHGHHHSSTNSSVNGSDSSSKKLKPSSPEKTTSTPMSAVVVKQEVLEELEMVPVLTMEPVVIATEGAMIEDGLGDDVEEEGVFGPHTLIPVGEKKIRFGDIDEDEATEIMDEDEYTFYFEVWQAINS